MITDPDDPDYRYPDPGERLFHVPWRRWVTVTGSTSPDDEVAVTFDDGRSGTVKLRSLEPEEMR